MRPCSGPQHETLINRKKKGSRIRQGTVDSSGSTIIIDRRCLQNALLPLPHARFVLKDAVIRECDATGVDVQVVCTVPVMFNYHLPSERGAAWARVLNDDLAATCRARASRMVGLGTLPLQDPAAAVQELRRCVLELGLRGVQVGSHVDAPDAGGHRGRRIVPLSAPELREVWREAERLGAAVLVHPWDMQWWCDNKYWLPWLVGMPAETAAAGAALVLGGVLAQCPALRVMLSHGGGALPFLAGRLDWGHKCRPDLVAVDTPGVAPREGMRRLYVDSITHDRDALKFLIDFMGAERVMMGSDYPFPLGEVASVAPGTGERLEVYPGHLIETSGLPAGVMRRLLAGTALEWLGMREGDFARAGQAAGPTGAAARAAGTAGTAVSASVKQGVKRGRALRSFVANAFVTAAGGAYSGNPAAVVLVPRGDELSDAQMKTIAAQMNLSETAFVTPVGDGSDGCSGDNFGGAASRFGLRWYTPTVEVSLCGHATLATAAVLCHELGNTAEVLRFDTLSGELRVRRRGGGLLELDLPMNAPEDALPTPAVAAGICEAVHACVDGGLDGGAQARECKYSAATKKLVVRMPAGSLGRVRGAELPAKLLEAHDGGEVRGVILTSAADPNEAGASEDFVSRYFAPWVGIPEDPVTGSAHTVLVPHWGKELGKAGERMTAKQLSARQGELQVRGVGNERVELAGKGAIVSRGEVERPL